MQLILALGGVAVTASFMLNRARRGVGLQQSDALRQPAPVLPSQ
ncbi:MAG: hypothetical protein WBB25_20860 [Sulfitobacter sp.]